MPDTAESVLRRFLRAYDELDWDTWDTLAHADHRFHFPLAPVVLDRAGHLGLCKEFRTGFSTMEHRIEGVVAAGPMVAVRGVVRVTHDGVFQDIAPTGKVIDVTFMDFARVEDGQVAEEWVELNTPHLMAELGAG